MFKVLFVINNDFVLVLTLRTIFLFLELRFFETVPLGTRIVLFARKRRALIQTTKKDSN